MGSPTQDMIETHLTYLGWGLQYTENGRIAVRPRDNRPSIAFRPHAGGLLFYLTFETTEASRADRVGYLSVINEINRNTVVATASSQEHGEFLLESWWPDCYDKTAFGNFIELFANDVERVLSEFWRRTPPYLVEIPEPLPPVPF